jgi:AcrR family transcriptional regulator
MNTSDLPSLRERQKASTRELILETATEIFLRPEGSFSHEAIALRAGMSARTVYRHFPTQADLFRAMWERHREATETRFPGTEAELLPLVHAQFRHFEEHAAFVDAILAHPSSAEILRHGWQEGHAAFREALAGITATLPEAQARWLVAVCQSIFSAPFWQMLRTRGRLSGEEAADAAAWAMEAVLDAARSRVRVGRPVGAGRGRDAS